MSVRNVTVSVRKSTRREMTDRERRQVSRREQGEDGGKTDENDKAMERGEKKRTEAETQSKIRVV